MGILDRLSRLLRANVNDMLDRFKQHPAIAPLIAEAISRISLERSVSSLFD